MPIEIREATEADATALHALRRNPSYAAELLLGDALADTANQFWFVVADGADIFGWLRCQRYDAEAGVVTHPGWYIRRLFLTRTHREGNWQNELWAAAAAKLDALAVTEVHKISLGAAFDQWGFETVASYPAFKHPDLPTGKRLAQFALKRASAPYVTL